ncbi:hypothetical protein P170DRAFT_370333 [Aspergillus steynii IBT 23096]|uniref:Uncharacterized protein n=1 Tax=Aspergillus steynii IBT 23096 TaxID=1392250 RepID=A0A2I2FRR6_9EURO|nr:uncharacterized protein P170DRAFT_370333 [Aspergillus steynii IBT 23096]PLB43324.1 hypothetical protein P170DRAFT_370333 [Aspergillus steynii IBT 23096]
MDTALPPMSSKQLVTASSRRHLRGSESSIVIPNFRGNNQRAAATLGIGAPDSFSGLMGRGGPGSHRRTGSTLRTVMKKIFTRKRGSQHDGFDSDFHFSSANSSHPSQVNGAVGDPSFSLPNSLSSKRSGGLAQKEIGNGGPMTLNDALAKLEIRPPRQRRATLPSLIFSDDESRDALEDVISGRPDGNRSRKNSLRPNHDPMEDRRRKRRSRSAGQLRGMARDHRMSPIQWRRRSVESYVGSTAYTAVSDSELSIRPPTRATVTSLKPYTEPSVYSVDQVQTNVQVETESIAPNAGTLVNAMHDGDNLSTEQRLATLEVKLIDLEFAIARMQTGQSNASSSPVQTPVPPKKSEPATATNRRHNRKKSTARSPPDTSYSTQEPDRPVSTGTIRPGTTHTVSTSGNVHRSRTLQPPSCTSLSDTHSISIEQYSALVMLLRREQTARRNLEGEVSSLRDDIKQLQCMARESVGVGTMYPIRSADSQEFLRMRQAGRSATTSPARTEDKFGCPSPYESDSEWDRPEIPAKDELYKSRWQNRRVEVQGMI